MPAMSSPEPASIRRCIVRQCAVSAIVRSCMSGPPASIGCTAAPYPSRIMPSSNAKASARANGDTKFLA